MAMDQQGLNRWEMGNRVMPKNSNHQNPEANPNQSESFPILVFLVILILGLAFAITSANDQPATSYVDMMIWLVAGTLVMILIIIHIALRKQAINREIQERKESSIEHILDNARTTLAIEMSEQRVELLVRLAAISFEHPEHHWKVMKIITNFIRDRAHFSPTARREKKEETPQDSINSKASATTSSDDGDTTVSSSPSSKDEIPNDIQTALRLIGRRKWESREPRPLDLCECNLSRCDLWEGQFSRTLFMNSNLDSAGLGYANFSDTNLSYTLVRNGRAEGVQMDRAILVSADFSGTDLTRAIMNLVKARGAKFNDAILLAAVLSRADLRRADFRGANLNHVHFTDAMVDDADFSTADITYARWKGAIYNKGTRFPPGFNPKEKGMLRREDVEEEKLSFWELRDE